MRNFSASAALFAAFSLVTACGGEDGNNPDEPGTETPDVIEPSEDGTCPTGMVLKGDGPTRQCLAAQSSLEDDPPDEDDDPGKEPEDPDDQQVADAGPEEPADAEAPPTEMRTCVQFVSHPDWEWLARADGRRFICGRTECDLQLLDGADGCEAKCDPAMWELVQDLEHLDGINFRFEYDVDGNTFTCNAM